MTVLQWWNSWGSGNESLRKIMNPILPIPLTGSFALILGFNHFYAFAFSILINLAYAYELHLDDSLHI
jgi:hypothetical protein